MTSVKLVTCTPDAEQLMAYVARVSNPSNQPNPNYSKLLSYCIEHEHWSVFEQAYMTLEIETSLAIATQILRHRSFTFQQFSQRYAESTEIQIELPVPELRRQDVKNRQNSISNLPPGLVEDYQNRIKKYFEEGFSLYQNLLDVGVAKECARFVLPQATNTRIYMTGSCRSWLHYIKLRSAHGTQKEHMEVAEGCRKIFKEQFPSISESLGW